MSKLVGRLEELFWSDDTRQVHWKCLGITSEPLYYSCEVEKLAAQETLAIGKSRRVQEVLRCSEY
jgi:hypothetical protein